MKRIKLKRHSTGGKKVAGLPFMGEIMECTMCHKQQKSDPKVESGWTMIQMDETKVYVCPNCFGNMSDESANPSHKKVGRGR